MFQLKRPDFLPFVVHFTKDAVPISVDAEASELAEIAVMTAKQRLFAILEDGRIRASRMPCT